MATHFTYGLVQTAATFVKVPIFITDSVERSGDVC